VSLRDIKGQDRVLEFLKRSIERDTLAQAYIFAGPRGTGRFSTAIEFAKAVNCAQPSEHDACDTCARCTRIGKRSHPDLIVVMPADGGSGEVEIDMVRDLKYLVNLKPYEMRKKVCIIDGADMMNQEASNAILKTLEEPPQSCILILIVENVARMLPTISSRCQLVKFLPLAAEELEAVLVREYAMDRPKAHALAHFFSGKLGEAIRSKDGDLLRKKNRLIDDLLNGLLFDEERLIVSKEEVSWALDVMLSWYRDLVMAKLGMESSMWMHVDREDLIARLASDDRLAIDELIQATTEIMRTRLYLQSNVNPKLAWAVLGGKVGKRGVACTR
jgi:DNA polymerase-3 subunit delta'